VGVKLGGETLAAAVFMGAVFVRCRWMNFRRRISRQPHRRSQDDHNRIKRA